MFSLPQHHKNDEKNHVEQKVRCEQPINAIAPAHKQGSGKRYAVLDGLRGAALINMVLYHAIWDLVYLFGFHWNWYQSKAAYIWQQAICWTFIFLSGFCLPFSRKGVKRGVIVFLAGAAVSLVTLIFTPESRIIFGVLTLIGSCMILVSLANPLLKRCPASVGLCVSFLLFLCTKTIAEGYIGFGAWRLLELPEAWYCNWFTTYLGLPMKDFFSTDYFALLPWLFLFITGYFLHHIARRREWLAFLKNGHAKPLEWVGRHSLLIYMLHQPLIYLLLLALYNH